MLRRKRGDQPGPPQPNFLIVGVMKGGTSSLHWYLGQHPEVFVTPRKELHFFDRAADRQARSLESYLTHFATAGAYPARGESTPSYCFVPGAIPAIAEFNPAMRIIIMLRDPVARAISHIEHRRRVAKRPSKSIVHGEIWDELLADLRAQPWWMGRSMATLARGYHARGHYHEQLRRIYKHFPADQVAVVRLEDLRVDPQAQLDRVTDLLGVARHRFSDLTPSNVNAYERPEERVYEYLASYYLLHNEILTRDFGIRTDDWRVPSAGRVEALGPRPLGSSPA